MSQGETGLGAGRGIGVGARLGMARGGRWWLPGGVAVGGLAGGRPGFAFGFVGGSTVGMVLQFATPRRIFQRWT
jgi:hypothetical protein